MRVSAVGKQLSAAEVASLADALPQAGSCGYRFALCPLFGSGDLDAPPLSGSDLVLRPDQWSSAVVGLGTPGFDMDNSSDGSSSTCDAGDASVDGTRAAAALQQHAAAVLERDVRWASHLSLQALVVPVSARAARAPHGCVNLARHVASMVAEYQGLRMWLLFDMDAGAAAGEDDGDGVHDSSSSSSSSSDAARDGALRSWLTVSQIAGPSAGESLGVVLRVPVDAPQAGAIDRWMSEPLRAVLLPSAVFLTNKSGYPVLTQAHQAIVRSVIARGLDIVVEGGDRAHRQYIDFLRSKVAPPTELQQFEGPYYDVLQIPLQPLFHNLSSSTYEIFERDPVKYDLYQQAIEKALRDRAARARTIVVMVVGAGRGPLVRATLAASDACGVQVTVYAVEKNPSAVHTLRHLHAMQAWGARVTIVAADMRQWQAPLPADILVSELLGSFGDNELSPECLDGAQRFLAPDGVSIPCSSTSWLAPVSNFKVHSDIGSASSNAAKDYDTMYVVRLHSNRQLAESQAAFTFVHPNRTQSPIDNTRTTRLAFRMTDDAVLHGFAGFFSSCLYADVNMSTNPQTFSTGMFSWFPAFVPLRSPVRVRRGDTVEVAMWRRVDAHKVWYEWCLVQPTPSCVQNLGGKHTWIGL